jgi:hypothetical protein
MYEELDRDEKAHKAFPTDVHPRQVDYMRCGLPLSLQFICHMLS